MKLRDDLSPMPVIAGLGGVIFLLGLSFVLFPGWTIAGGIPAPTHDALIRMAVFFGSVVTAIGGTILGSCFLWWCSKELMPIYKQLFYSHWKRP